MEQEKIGTTVASKTSFILEAWTNVIIQERRIRQYIEGATEMNDVSKWQRHSDLSL